MHSRSLDIGPDPTKRVVAFAIDDSLKYHYMLLGAISSIRRFHGENWIVRVYSVDAGNDIATRLKNLGCEVRDAVRTNPLLPHSYFPCSAAKCQALADTQPDELVITLDADGLILSSFDPLVDQFLQSKTDIAMLPETDERGNVASVKECWFNCPDREFRDTRTWMDKPILNCGMVMGRGQSASRIGTKALRLVRTYEKTLYLGEQGPVNGVIYDEGYNVFELKPYHHCVLISEEHLTFVGVPYMGERVLLDGQPIVYRHFGNRSRYSEGYQAALDCMLSPVGFHGGSYWQTVCQQTKLSQEMRTLYQ